MITIEQLKNEYKKIKEKYPNKENYLLGWLDCILYIIKEQKNDK